MTRDDIIRMAVAAGFEEGWIQVCNVFPEIEALCNLAASAEREACAQIVYRHTGIPMDALRNGTGVRDRIVILGEQIMAAIRARGTP